MTINKQKICLTCGGFWTFKSSFLLLQGTESNLAPKFEFLKSVKVI